MYFGPIYKLTIDQRIKCRIKQRDYAKKVSKMIKNREYTVGSDGRRITFRIVSILPSRDSYDVNEYRLNVVITKVESKYYSGGDWINDTPYEGERVHKYYMNRYKEWIRYELWGFLNIFGFDNRYGDGSYLILETPKIINRR